MDPSVVQNLRYKLQKRVGRLNSVDSQLFPMTLLQFWQFFDRQPTFAGVREALLAEFPGNEQTLDRIWKGEEVHGGTEEEAAAIGYGVLRRLAEDANPRARIWVLGQSYGGSSKEDQAVEVIRQAFLEPFYEYVDEQLDDQRAMLALLMRYKHRSEWFRHPQLFELTKAGKGEFELAMDLYAYLYDQGIDLTIEPLSLRGRVDLIAAQDTHDPLLLDAKVFDNANRDKRYIRKGFAQLYTYTQQHNQPFGYLLIYNVSDKDLRFSLRAAGEIPVVVHNHKTIFLITVDLCPHEKPVSQRDPLNAVELTEEELVTLLREESAVTQAGR